MTEAFPAASEPPQPCTKCPRLHSFVEAQRPANPTWHNAPVPSFGDPQGQLLIVGLAPGMRGANRTGRPFTGDYAGKVLYAALAKYGLTSGTFDEDGEDDLTLHNVAITNAVRCVPPQNKPVGAEIKTCNPFLSALLEGMSQLRVILALGRISHDAVLTALGEKRSLHGFGHNAMHPLRDDFVLVDSYHCSRYNMNTGRLTVPMFDDVFATIKVALNRS
ncbi:MAG: uracil-DNA glycosylase [Pseudomonadota bacterium]